VHIIGMPIAAIGQEQISVRQIAFGNCQSRYPDRPIATFLVCPDDCRNSQIKHAKAQVVKSFSPKYSRFLIQITDGYKTHH